MRILCIIEALGSGGAERQLTGLAALLKEDGNQVRVLTYYPKDFYKPVLDKAGVEYQYLAKAQSRIKRLPKLAKAIKDYHPDTVITYSPSAGEISCVLKRIGFRFKLIVSERNTTQTNSRSERLKFFCYRWADWIVPNSQMQANFIIEHYPNLRPKVRVITNFVDTVYFSPHSAVVDSSKVNMICVGRDNPQKNQLRFFEAIKVLVNRGINLHVDWYGSFETLYGQQCKDKIRELRLENVIILKGETKNVRDEYRVHSVFCLPSLYEGFPNVLCEAMSCGLPALCSNVCDNATIVDEHKGGLLFNPTDINDMVEKIEQFLNLDSMTKEEMGWYNREKAVTMFSSSAFLSKYKEII